MKNIVLKTLVLFIVLFACSCSSKPHSVATDMGSDMIFCLSDSSKRAFEGENNSRIQLEMLLNDSSFNGVPGGILIKDKKTLIQIAEPILFAAFGRKSVVSERPYEIYLFGDYWLMNGTLPRDILGGTFSIAIDRRTCKVVGISRGK